VGNFALCEIDTVIDRLSFGPPLTWRASFIPPDNTFLEAGDPHLVAKVLRVDT
jgi:hypothetical protein